MSSRLATRTGVAAVVSSTLCLVGLAVPSAAHAANGVFLYTGPDGQQSIPFPDEDKCYPAEGAKMAANYTPGDAYLYTDSSCTIGKDAGNVKPFANNTVEFNSLRIHTSN